MDEDSQCKKHFESWFFQHREACWNLNILLDDNDANSMWEGFRAAWEKLMPDINAPKRYWLIEQTDLDDDDDYKVIHTADLDVYPNAKILGEYILKEPTND